MLKLLRSELYRISKTKSFWILTLVLILLGQLSAAVSGSVNQANAITGAMGFLDSFGKDVLFLVILCAFVATYVCAGFEQRTLQGSLAAGYGRGTILVGKALGAYGVSFVMLLAYSLSFVAHVLLSKGGGMGIENDVAVRMVLVFIAAYLQYIAQVTLVVLLGFVIRRVGIVMAILITLFSVGILLLGFAAIQYPWVGQIVQFTPLAGNGSIVSGFTVPYTSYFHLMALSLVWIVGLLALAYANFRKLELR